MSDQRLSVYFIAASLSVVYLDGEFVDEEAVCMMGAVDVIGR